MSDKNQYMGFFRANNFYIVELGGNISHGSITLLKISKEEAQAAEAEGQDLRFSSEFQDSLPPPPEGGALDHIDYYSRRVTMVEGIFDEEKATIYSTKFLGYADVFNYQPTLSE